MNRTFLTHIHSTAIHSAVPSIRAACPSVTRLVALIVLKDSTDYQAFNATR